MALPNRLHIMMLGSLLLPACMDQDYQYIEWEGVDVFYQNPSESVDILMVIDNSGSMEPYQRELGQHFSSFLTYFTEADVDYRITAVTTDVMAADAGVLQGDPITPETTDADQSFSDMVSVGTTGSGFEMGLEAAYMALTEPLVSTTNAGFLRDEASLSLIFVSDEEDSSPLPVNDYINAFREIKGQRERDVFNASALVVTDIAACTGEARDWSTEGTRYVDVAQQTAGVLGNICAEDFSNIVTELSLNTSRLRDTFYLSDDPDPTTLYVSIDDTELPCEDGAWVYERVEHEETGEEVPAIVFEREQMPPANSQIAVRYYFGDGDPAQFCGASGADTGE